MNPKKGESAMAYFKGESTPAMQRARLRAACLSIREANKKRTASIKKSYVIDSTHYTSEWNILKPRPPFNKPFPRG